MSALDKFLCIGLKYIYQYVLYDTPYQTLYLSNLYVVFSGLTIPLPPSLNREVLDAWSIYLFITRQESW